MKSLLDHVQCTACDRQFSADQVHTVCPNCGKVLFARYDLPQARTSMPRDFSNRPSTMWRYRELMPVRDEANLVSLGEGMTPLLRAARLGRAYGFERLFIKEEGLNPTGTFKARGMAAAVSRARELGIRSFAAPSAGNAAAALAAYGAKAGIETWVFMPADAPEINKIESAVCGARVFLVEGLTVEEHGLALELDERYPKLDPGLADLSVVILAHRLGTRRLLTFDERDFRTLRPIAGGTFQILPADA